MRMPGGGSRSFDKQRNTLPNGPRAAEDKKLALVTGATHGIGYECTRVLAGQGYNLIAVARDTDRLHVVAKELMREFGVSVTSITCDLSESGAADRLYGHLQDKALLPLDILINNAGRGIYGDFLDIDADEEEAMIRLNAITPTRLTKLVARGMLKRAKGRILMVSSTSAFKPGPHNAVYSATKAYLLSLSEALGAELAGSGVTVTVLCPGATETNFATAAGMSDKHRTKWKPTANAKAVACMGIAAMHEGKSVAVPGAMNKILAIVLKLLPQSMLLKLMSAVRGGARRSEV